MTRAPRRGIGLRSFVLALALLGAGCDQDVAHEERSKAEDLQAEVGQLDIDIPVGVAASLYGTDGGAVCEDAAEPGGLTGEAASAVSYRFTLRETEADRDDVRYLRAVVKTYCPEELDSYNDYVDGLAVGDAHED